MEKEKRRIIRLEFVTTEPAAKQLERSLLSLSDTKVQIKLPERKEELAFSIDGILTEQIFMLILTVGSNLATIASLLYQILKERKSKEQSIVFRLGEKKVEISGKFSKDDIELILEKFAQVATGDKEERLLDETRRKELEKELSDLKEIFPIYQKLTKSAEWKKSEEALKKLKEYQTRQREIENRITVLEKLLQS